MSESHDVSQLRSSNAQSRPIPGPDTTSTTGPGTGRLSGLSPQDDLDTVVADGLTQRQLNALDLLMSGATVTDAAKKIGVCRRTVTRWKNEVEPFKA